MSKKKIVIIGASLGAMYAAIRLGKAGHDVTIYEMGPDYEDRPDKFRHKIQEHFNPLELQSKRCNVCGVGGAGTTTGGTFFHPPISSKIWKHVGFSDGDWAEFVRDLKEVVPFLPEAAFEKTTWLPGNIMRRLVTKLHEQASAVAQIKTKTLFTEFEKEEKFKLTLFNSADVFKDECDKLILATGRAGIHSISRCNAHLSDLIYERTPDLGFRVICLMDKFSIIRDAFNTAIEKVNKNGVISSIFCVCRHGGVSEVEIYPGMFVHDGLFPMPQPDLVNFAIMVNMPQFIKDYTDAIHFIKPFQQVRLTPIRVQDFIPVMEKKVKASPKFGPVINTFIEILETAARQFPKKKRQEIYNLQLFVPAIDNLNPRIWCDENMETPIPGLHLIGDVSGFSRGFLQSFGTGYVVSRCLIP